MSIADNVYWELDKSGLVPSGPLKVAPSVTT